MQHIEFKIHEVLFLSAGLTLFPLSLFFFPIIFFFFFFFIMIYFIETQKSKLQQN